MTTTITSLPDRLKKLVMRSVMVGLCLVAVGLLAWLGFSERRDGQLYNELGSSVVEADPAIVDAALEGRVVHLSASPISAVGARDDWFGLDVEGFALRRESAMFQWFEEAQGKGLKKRYDYYLDWCDCRNDSSKFHEPKGHENPDYTVEEKIFLAADAKIGAYALRDDALVKNIFLRYVESSTRIAPNSTVNMAADVLDLPELPERLTGQGWYRMPDGESYYRGNPNTDEPELGDIAVTFTELKAAQPMSFVGVQKADGIEVYRRDSGAAVVIAQMGEISGKEQIKQKRASEMSAVRLFRTIAIIVLTLVMGLLGKWMSPMLGVIPIVAIVARHSAFGGGAMLGLVIAGLIVAMGKITLMF
jgi:Transmembrane protein 43